MILSFFLIVVIPSLSDAIFGYAVRTLRYINKPLFYLQGRLSTQFMGLPFTFARSWRRYGISLLFPIAAAGLIYSDYSNTQKYKALKVNSQETHEDTN